MKIAVTCPQCDNDKRRFETSWEGYTFMKMHRKMCEGHRPFVSGVDIGGEW